MPALNDRVSLLGNARRALLQHRLASRGGRPHSAAVHASNGHLVAYVVPGKGTPLSASELRAFLRTQLPAYMVPASFVLLERLPRTGGGKLDRQALPAPNAVRPTLAAPSVQPRTDRERQIAAIWSDLLRVDRIDVNDNFFDLGGHSLLMVRLQTRLREVVGADIGIVELFRYPTVASLAAFVETRSDAQPDITADAQERAHRQRAVLQRRRTAVSADEAASNEPDRVAT